MKGHVKMYLKFGVVILAFFVSGCSLIDKGRIPEEVNVKGVETAFARVGSTTTRYQSTNKIQSETKENNTIWYKDWKNYFEVICIILQIMLIIYIRKINKKLKKDK